MQDSLTRVVANCDTSKVCVAYSDIIADPLFASSALIGVKAPVGTDLGE